MWKFREGYPGFRAHFRQGKRLGNISFPDCLMTHRGAIGLLVDDEYLLPPEFAAKYQAPARKAGPADHVYAICLIHPPAHLPILGINI